MGKIVISHVSKEFQLEDDTIKVINDLDLEINTDQITVILGKSGCGKTTLLRILSNLETKDNGEIIYPEDYKSSFVFQEPRLMPWLNVKDNISFGVNKKDEKQEKLVNDLIEMVGLSGFESAYPNQISGGMKQRVALARALAFQPKLIYMDEPFAALDYFTRLNMQDELIKTYYETKCGLLFVTHNVDEALKLAHKIVVINEGKVAKEYSFADDLLTRDVLSQEYIDIRKDILNEIK